MNPKAPAALAALQQWMQSAITRPAAGGEYEPAAEALVRPSATLRPAARVEIYRRSYHARLLACFRDTLPCLRHALGDALLDRFALEYLDAHPPRSYTLGELARRFPEYLAETRPDREMPAGEREAWPDFLIELASVEIALLDVADGPGLENAEMPAAPDLYSLSPARLLGARFVPSPALRLFACSHPIADYVRGVRAGKAPPPPDPGKSQFALSRRDLRVVLTDLTAPEHALLSALTDPASPRTVGEALALRPDAPDLAAVQTRISEWTTRGFFAEVVC